MTRNEELAIAFEAAASAANPYQSSLQQQDYQGFSVSNVDLQAQREAALVSRVLAAIGAVYRKTVTGP